MDVVDVTIVHNNQPHTAADDNVLVHHHHQRWWMMASRPKVGEPRGVEWMVLNELFYSTANDDEWWKSKVE